MENLRKHRAIKLVTTDEITKLSYNKTIFREFIGNRNEKKKKKIQNE